MIYKSFLYRSIVAREQSIHCLFALTLCMIMDPGIARGWLNRILVFFCLGHDKILKFDSVNMNLKIFTVHETSKILFYFCIFINYFLRLIVSFSVKYFKCCRVNSPNTGCLPNIGIRPQSGQQLYCKGEGRFAALHFIMGRRAAKRPISV